LDVTKSFGSVAFWYSASVFSCGSEYAIDFHQASPKVDLNGSNFLNVKMKKKTMLCLFF